MRILFNEDFTVMEISLLWEISRYGLVTIISTVENECLGLGCNGAFPMFRFDTPHIEFIIESYKDTFIEMKRTITQPKLPGT